MSLLPDRRKPILIGIGHAKRHGKDTVAQFLIEKLRQLGYVAVRVSFADKLKEVCYIAYRWAGLRPGDYYDHPDHAAEREIVLPKVGKTPRQIWIEVGNKLREVHPETWINAALDDSRNADFIVIPDTRYPNEVDAIKAAGGFVVKVHRPGLPEANDVADCALKDFNDWDDVISNVGDLDRLKFHAETLARVILKLSRDRELAERQLALGA